MDAPVHNPSSALARHAPHLHASQCIAGMDADAHDVAGLDELGLNLFQCFVSNDRIAVLAGVAAASTYNQRGVITPIPNDVSLGLTKWTRIDKGSFPLFAARGSRIKRAPLGGVAPNEHLD